MTRKKLQERNAPQLLNILGTIFFGCAVAHTFLVKKFQHIAKRYSKGSAGENFFHLLGEVEVVFGIWAVVYIICMAIISGFNSAIHYVQGRNFTEPMFVIMAVCSTRPSFSFIKDFIERESLFCDHN